MKVIMKVISDNNLKKIFKKELKELEKDIVVYYRKANAKCPYPHMVFSFEKRVSEELKLITLEVNVYDNDADTTKITEIADKIERQFDDAYYKDGIYALESSLETRNLIEDQAEKSINRERLTFNIEMN